MTLQVYANVWTHVDTQFAKSAKTALQTITTGGHSCTCADGCGDQMAIKARSIRAVQSLLDR